MAILSMIIDGDGNLAVRHDQKVDVLTIQNLAVGFGGKKVHTKETNKYGSPQFLTSLEFPEGFEQLKFFYALQSQKQA